MISTVSTGLAVLALALQASAQNAAWAQCGGNPWTGSTACVSGYTCVFSSEWYSQCIPGTAATTAKTSSTTTKTASVTVKTSSTTAKTSTTSIKTTTSAAGGGGIVTPTKVTTVFPSATGETKLASPTTITGVFDGKMARWHRTSADVCQGQTETGEADTIFILADGATLANVIIGKNQAEGVHCKGTCTLINVWHEEVCEDAMTFKQSSGTSYVIGGGARNADDKIMQFNGSGKVVVKYFYAENFGKVMRHCGTCGIIERHTTFDGIVATGGGVVVGINTNAGDTTSISNSCLKNGTKYGDRYNAVSSGEPTKVGSCPSGTACVAVNNVATC